MDSINYSLLENLSDDELQVISRNIDLDMLLQPIKQNSKQYARQSSVLGRVEKKSLLVQKNLPNVAYDLFKKNDVNYVKLFAISVKNLKNVLLDIIETGTNGDVTVDKTNIAFKNLENVVFRLDKVKDGYIYKAVVTSALGEVVKPIEGTVATANAELAKRNLFATLVSKNFSTFEQYLNSQC